jgi:hypothetical protein
VQVCVIKGSTFEKERLILSSIRNVEVSTTPRVMAITLTLGIIISLTKGIIYLNAWAVALLGV